MTTFAEKLDYIQPFGNRYRIIRRAEFLIEIWYMLSACILDSYSGMASIDTQATRALALAYSNINFNHDKEKKLNQLNITPIAAICTLYSVYFYERHNIGS